MGLALLLALALLTSAVGCASGTPEDPPSLRHLLTERTSSTPNARDASTPLRWIIDEAEDMDVSPSAVLSVRVWIPQLLDGKEYVFPLERKQVPPGYVSRIGAHFAGEAADGVSESGRGIGYVGGVNLVGATDNGVTVRASFAGRGPNLERVDLTDRFTVEWGGRYEGTFHGDGRIVASIRLAGN